MPDICNPCLDCPPPNLMVYDNCNPLPVCSDADTIDTDCVTYTGPILTALSNVVSQSRFNDILVALDTQIGILLNIFPVKPPCVNLTGTPSAVLTNS